MPSLLFDPSPDHFVDRLLFYQEGKNKGEVGSLTVSADAFDTVVPGSEILKRLPVASSPSNHLEGLALISPHRVSLLRIAPPPTLKILYSVVAGLLAEPPRARRGRRPELLQENFHYTTNPYAAL